MVVWKMMFLYAMEHVVDFILVFGGVWLDIFIFVLGIGWRRSWISMAVGLWLWFNMINPSAGPDSCGEESLSLSLSIYYIWIYICIHLYMYREWKRMKKDMLQSTNLGGSISGWFGGYMSARNHNCPKWPHFVFQQLEVNRPQKPPVKTDPSFWGSRRRRSSSSSSSSSSSHKKTSTKVEGLQGRQSAREESFQAAEEMNCRHGCRLCFVYLGKKHPIKNWSCCKTYNLYTVIQEPWSTGKTMKS